MTVFTHFYSLPQYVFKIDRSCFYPVPNVHGALATFSLLPSADWPCVRDEREFLVFVRQAFLSKRKMLTNSLQPMWSRETVAAALHELGVSEQVRFISEMVGALYVACAPCLGQDAKCLIVGDVQMMKLLFKVFFLLIPMKNIRCVLSDAHPCLG